jgi:hypothetical protein
MKSKPLSIYEKLSIINKVDSVMTAPRTEEPDIPVRKVTDKILGWTHISENVLRLSLT